MRLRLTLVDPGSGTSTSVRVEAARGDTVGDLRPLLAAATRLDPGLLDRLQVGGTLLEDDRALGEPPLLDGAVVRVGARRPEPRRRPAVLRLEVVGGPDAGRVHDLPPGRHLVGRDPAAAVSLADPGVSREHLELEVSDTGVTLLDRSSTNGVLALDTDGTPGPAAATATAGTHLRLGASTLALRAGSSRPVRTESVGDGTLLVHRQPRDGRTWTAPTLAEPRAPALPVPRRFPWVGVLLPLPVAGVLAVLWGPQMLVLGLLGPLTALGTAVSERVASRREEREAAEAYARAHRAYEADLAAALAAERIHLLRAHPDPAALLRVATLPGERLWERSPGDGDLLTVRLGLGSVPAATRTGATEPRSGGPVLAEAPVVADLARCGSLGLTDGRAGRAAAAARALVAGLAVLVPPSALAVHVLPRRAAGEDDGVWAWVGLLPHAEGDGSAAEMVDALTKVVRERATSPRGEAPRDERRHLVLVPDSALVAATPGLAELVRDGADHGVHCLVVDEGAGLPAAVRSVVRPAPDGLRHRLDRPDGSEELLLDGVGPWFADRVGRALAPLREAARSARTALPERAGLLALDGVAATPASVAERWARGEGPVAVLGATATGTHTVDLRSDGPHVLVGGTTGSGKSELLRCLVGGLALRSGPRDLALVLVDYKGGAAFGDLRDLPHVAALVTDLDGERVERALAGLEAELARREAVLATTGSKDVDEHRSRVAPDAGLPRLVLVVDELRALVEELPDFVRGLVRVAALGRSLGVHLVLATQRPAGVVTPDIAANVNLRIALRVRDRVDSDAIIEAPDAAALPLGVPGRAIASVGGTRTTFQTALVAGDDGVAPPLRVTGPRGAAAGPSRVPGGGCGLPSGGPGLVDLLTRAAASTGAGRPMPPWQEPLPSALPLLDVRAPSPGADGTADPVLPLGLVDVPREQRTEPLLWRPAAEGHLALLGGPRSGRTSALRTVVGAVLASGAPWHVHVVAADTGLAPLADLPCVGSVVPLHDRVLLDRLLTRLEGEAAARRGDGTAGPRRPRILLLVDGWDSLVGAVGDLASLELSERLLRLLRDGPAVGLHCAATGGRVLVAGRAADAFGRRLALDGLPATDVLLLGLRSGRPEEHGPRPGRGRDAASGLVVQVAHPGTTPDPQEQLAGLRLLASTDRPTVPAPYVVRHLPSLVPLAALPRDGSLTVALDAEGLPRGFSPEDHHVLVAGARRSGRSTALRVLASRLQAAGREVLLVVGAGAGPRDDSAVPADDVDTVVGRLRRRPGTDVLVDDLDLLVGHPLEPVLTDLVQSARARGAVVAAAADTAQLGTVFRGPAHLLLQRRTGMLLGPVPRSTGDLFAVDVRGASELPGRGLLVRGGRAREVQVATDRPHPGPAASGDPASAAAARPPTATSPTAAAATPRPA